MGKVKQNSAEARERMGCSAETLRNWVRQAERTAADRV